ncbi:MAG: PQQ-binding-like beta-propeller repeat protein [Planctomycetes bacterium]|nr:PQQ-binding-like beta-propeller repeat protein [Planctomycetota bacterium]
MLRENRNVRNLRNLLPAVILLCAAAWPIALPAADWSQWGGADPGRNMVSAEKGLADSFVPGEKKSTGAGIDLATTKNVRWAARMGSYAYGNPTVAGGKVFIGTDDALMTDDPRLKRTESGMVQCLDEATGKLLWRLVVPKREKERLPKGAHYGQQKFGVCSSPAVADGRVYVVTNACEVVCLDPSGLADGNQGPFTDEGQYMVGPGAKPVELKGTDADILWVFDMIDQAGICPHDLASCSPLVYGGFVYTVTSNGVDEPHGKCPRPDAPSFIALDAKTGRLAATDNEGLGHRMWHCLWSPPSAGVVNGRPLVFFGGGDGVCYAFEAVTKTEDKPAHLKKVWSYDCVPPDYRFRDGKPIPYYAGDRRKKDSPNKNDGTYVGPSQIIGTPVFHEGRVYVAIGQDPAHGRGRGMLHCIDATKTGDITQTGRIWTYDAIERSMSSVAIAGGLLYVPDLSGKVHCLDVATGKPVWTHDTTGETWGTPLLADGKLFLGTKKHFVVMATGREPRELAKVSLGAPSYGTPVAANGVLYVASERFLWAVQKDAKPQVPPPPPAPPR